MSTPVPDPSLPAGNSPLSLGEMRGKSQAIADRLEELIHTLDA